MTYTPQVDSSHYEGTSYRMQERWNSYWHQLHLVHDAQAFSVLEIGVGEGVVARELRHRGATVTTLDIAPDLHPDVVGSVLQLPFPDHSFDLVLAAEILEHISFDDVPTALQEIARVSCENVIISVPRPGYVFMFSFKLPLLPKVEFVQKIPFFWKIHHFNGQHYWELGKKRYSVGRFLKCATEAGLRLRLSKSYADDPAHHFFVFSTRS